MRKRSAGRWKSLRRSESAVGGLKEVLALISGNKVYSRLKYESGVHRVQRVPATEQQGRVHTSAITVAVLPEADEVEIKVEEKDIRIDTFCSSGPGGQSVNTTYSAVRITHLPTGVIVSCQDEKSQIKNRAKAMRVLRSRLYEMELEKQQAAIGAERRSMVGTGDRSEKIRTYNFPQNRLTDHRIGLTLHQLDLVMEGKLDPIFDALTAHYQAEKLQKEGADGRRSELRLDHPHSARAGHGTAGSARVFRSRGSPPKSCSATPCTASASISTRIPSRNCAKSSGSTTAAICTSACRASRPSTSRRQQEFYGREFRVTPDVLIPAARNRTAGRNRSETAAAPGTI